VKKVEQSSRTKEGARREWYAVEDELRIRKERSVWLKVSDVEGRQL
jgi:hypothetical protein